MELPQMTKVDVTSYTKLYPKIYRYRYDTCSQCDKVSELFLNINT